MTLTIPEEENALDAAVLAETARGARPEATPVNSLVEAVQRAASEGAARVLICGSLYLAGRVLAEHGRETMSEVSGAGRR